MDLAFFGLTASNASEVRLNLFNQIHQIVFFGKGGYDWNTVYNMPIWLRKYTFFELKKYYEEKDKPTSANTAIGEDGLVKDQTVFNSTKKPQISKPGITPGKNPISYK